MSSDFLSVIFNSLTLYLCFQGRWTAAKLLLLLITLITPIIRLYSAVNWELGVQDGETTVCLDRC